MPKTCDLNKEEVFGPVATISRYSDFREVVETINDSRYGLQAGVFTKDFNKIMYAYHNLEMVPAHAASVQTLIL